MHKDHQILKAGSRSGELVGTCRFAKALYRQALALEGLQQSQNALEAMLAAQKQLPHDVQASTTASAPPTQHHHQITYTYHRACSGCP